MKWELQRLLEICDKDSRFFIVTLNGVDRVLPRVLPGREILFKGLFAKVLITEDSPPVLGDRLHTCERKALWQHYRIARKELELLDPTSAEYEALNRMKNLSLKRLREIALPEMSDYRAEMLLRELMTSPRNVVFVSRRNPLPSQELRFAGPA